IVLWTFIMLGLMAIGGYFMFRKFLKKLPREDGYSELDWQDHYIQRALPLWDEESKALLNELVSPVPELFRDAAKERIAGRISNMSIDDRVKEIILDHIIKLYIIATPKREHKFMKKKLNELEIDYTPYADQFQYADDEKQKFSIFEQT